MSSSTPASRGAGEGETVATLLVDLPEAAQLLGVSVWTARRWAKDGKLPRLKEGRRFRFPRAALAEWVRQNVVGGDGNRPMVTE